MSVLDNLRIGLGEDAHALVPDRRLVLGGSKQVTGVTWSWVGFSQRLI